MDSAQVYLNLAGGGFLSFSFFFFFFFLLGYPEVGNRINLREASEPWDSIMNPGSVFRMHLPVVRVVGYITKYHQVSPINNTQ